MTIIPAKLSTGITPKKLDDVETQILKAHSQLADLQTRFIKEDTFRFWKGIIMGKEKSGKTMSLLTAPRPLLVLNFDPDGLATIDKELRDPKAKVYGVDFSGDDIMHPSKYMEFIKAFEEMEYKGIFKGVATVALDSLTSLAQAMLNEIVNSAVRKKPESRVDGFVPDKPDYNKQKLLLIRLASKLMSLRCHSVVLGHLLTEFDNEGRPYFSLLLGPKAGANALPLFSEVYIAEKKVRWESKSGKERLDYYWQTEVDSAGKNAGSRRNRGNIVPSEVPQDFRDLFKKLNLKSEDVK